MRRREVVRDTKLRMAAGLGASLLLAVAIIFTSLDRYPFRPGYLIMHVMIMALLGVVVTLVFWAWISTYKLRKTTIKTLAKARDFAEDENFKNLDRRYKILYNNTPDTLMVIDEDGMVFEANSRLKDDFGYDFEHDMYGRSFIDVMVHPDDQREVGKNITEAFMMPSEACFFRYRIIKKDGSVAIVSCRTSYIREGQSKRLVISCRDVTKYQEVQEQLLISEQKFRSIMSQSVMSTMILDVDGNVLEVNDSFEKLFNTTRHKIAERKWNLFKDAQLEKVAPYLKEVFNGNSVIIPPTAYNVHYDPALPENIKYIEGRVYPVRDKAGKICNLVVVHVDRTEEVQIEIAFRELSECSLAFGMDHYRNISDLIAVAGRLIGATYLAYVKFETPEFGSAHTWSFPVNGSEDDFLDIYNETFLYHKNDIHTISDIRQTTDGSKGVVVKHGAKLYMGIAVRSNGAYSGVIAALFFDGDNNESRRVIMNSVRNMIGAEEVKRIAYRKILESEGKYSEIVENLDSVIFEMDELNRLSYINSAAEVMFGYKRSELIGKMAFSFVSPEAREYVEHMSKTFVPTKTTKVIEVPMVHKNGSIVYTEIRFNTRVRHGKIVATYGVMVNISERVVSRKKSKDRDRELIADLDDFENRITMLSVGKRFDHLKFLEESTPTGVKIP